MSVAMIGVEMSNEICEKIDQLLQKQEQKQENQDVIKITLPYELYMDQVDVNVLEAIHAKYLAERVGNDMFIKCDEINKEKVHRRLANSFRGTERIPDVGVWFTEPTGPERVSPIVNQCPPPDIPNPHPLNPTNLATPETNQHDRPTHVPYAIHWDASHTPVYYRLYWNEHIVLRCGWTLEFNIVLNALT
ncbi:15057_t:CDS:2 [Funneliformis geosporum]|uniref:8128_t:CDS:1 n=1 Tax=Funneliformis geosporum TaxID=1117311 RepID=A0A9W4SEN6_9GLOM|nr:8128_t:CDS:2 [Funneliformis geosporum]CAI2170066.1 15057_t:CDS:2 [Funneliformis geosporum]